MRNKKLILRMAGGLGNQLFELSYALNLAEKKGFNHITLDDSALSSYKAKHVNHLINFFDFKELDASLEFKRKLITKFRLPRFFGFKIKKWFLISDKNNESVSEPLGLTILDGYFIWSLAQKEFDEICVTLRRCLNLSPDIQFTSNECVVHIRGGDFVEIGWNKQTPDTYYLNAMDLMVSKYGIEQFIVITDDLSYAKKLLSTSPYKYRVESNDMKTDFYTIANSSKKIIGGSSFAIWAAALGHYAIGGVLIAPNFNVKLPNQIAVN